MAVIESPEYEATRLRLMKDPIVQDMAEEVRSVRRNLMAYEGGNPRFEFMMRANREYRERNNGVGADAHIGGVAEAILRLLDQ